MSLSAVWFPALFLSFLLPTYSLPVASPSILDSPSHTQPSVDSNFNAGVSATAPIVEGAPLIHGILMLPPPSGNPGFFLPQDSSAGGFAEPAPGSGADGSVSSNITQDESGTTDTSSTPLMMAYYPAWVANGFPPEQINFTLFDWIDFAFAMPNAGYELDWDGSDTAPDILKRLVDGAHRQRKKVKLSVGGWGGSKLFSPALESDSGRQTFADNIAIAYHQFDLDGIDIDWEYPGQLGDSRNSVSSNDTANFLEFLKLLRTTLPSNARITAAVQPTPFVDVNGQPMVDVRAFAEILDWVLIMDYDTWGSSSNPGPNAPLDNACQNSTQPAANAETAIKTWTAAGFSPSQLVLGVPSYGYISYSNASRLRQRDPNAPPPYIHALTDGGADSGQVQFRELVRQGVLCKDPNWSGSYLGCGGFTREWDACSSTPFLRSMAENQVITYDDAQSLERKSALAKERGLAGVNMFDIHGDTDQGELVNSVRRGLGLQFTHP